MKKIFIDGAYGTAGLSLKDKLSKFMAKNPNMIELIGVDNIDYKDEEKRYQLINEADIAILCLPENIATKTANDLSNSQTILIDASSSHRIHPLWTYGLIELNSIQIDKIKNSKKISNPGCFALGAISLLNVIKPYLNEIYPINIIGITGYSAGGNKAIKKQIENPIAFRTTSLKEIHKHIPEIIQYTGLKNDLSFMPSVANFKSGQMVEVTIFEKMLKNCSINNLLEIYKEHYKNYPHYHIKMNENSYLTPDFMENRDDLEIYINQPKSANYVQLFALYDNLGKGAAGSIMQIIELLVK